MTRPHNTVGGGAQTNANGLTFEEQVSLAVLIPSLDNRFFVNGNDISFLAQNGNTYCIARIFSQDKLWKDYFYLSFPGLFTRDQRNHLVVIPNIWSKMLRPDQVLIIETNRGPFFLVIEDKTQGDGGSVDEKLQTCNYKIEQYSRFLSAAYGTGNYRLDFAYFLDNWFATKQNSFQIRDPHTGEINIKNIPSYRDCFNYIEEAGAWYYFPQISNPASRYCIEALQENIKNALKLSTAWSTIPGNQGHFQPL